MALPILDTPTYELTLPSTGKKIKYRPFLVKEHKVLLTLADADNTEVIRVVKELINVCTFKKLNVSQLPHFDIEYIFLQLRSKSISEQVDVVVNCECGNAINATFNLENLTVERHPKHSNKIALNTQYGVELKYPTFEDVIKVYGSNNSSDIIDLIINNIKGVYDKTNYWDAEDQTKEELEEFINSLTKDQFDLIENFFATAPKVTQVVEADCNKCGKHHHTKIEGLSNFFV